MIHLKFRELLWSDSRPDDFYKFMTALPRSARQPRELVAEVLKYCARADPKI